MGKNKKGYLGVNNHGFISIYMLIILQFTLLFVTYLSMQTLVFATSKKTMDFIEIFLLQHTKNHFEKHGDEVEELQYQTYTISITYEELIANVVYRDGKQTYRMQIQYDDICQCVMKTAYPS